MSSGVEFEVDSYNYGRPRVPGQPGMGGFGGGKRPESKMVEFLLRHGLASSSGQAYKILTGLIIVNIVITFLVITYFL